MQSVIDVGPRMLGLLCPIRKLVYSTLPLGLSLFYLALFFFQVLLWCVCIFVTSTCSTYPTSIRP